MSDLVERLRKRVQFDNGPHDPLSMEAADRIEALEKALRGARTLCSITTRGSIAKAIELIDRALEATDDRS